MENKVRTYAFYNSVVKKEWLENYSLTTQTIYGRIFEYAMDMEDEVGYDLYDFDISEIRELLRSLEPLSGKIAVDNGSVVKKYISWAIEEGYRKNDTNPLQYVDSSWFKQFVSEDVEMFLSKERIDKICMWCNNAQDEVIIRLIFEGAWGAAGSEVLNIKKTDVDKGVDNLVILTDDDGETRHLHVSDECMLAIEHAIYQRIYFTRNGRYSESKKREVYELVTNQYVVRNAITRISSTQEPAHNHVIYRRFAMIREEYPLDHFTTHMVRTSGMLFYAKEMIEKDGELLQEHLEVIAKRYDYNDVNALKNIVNVENVQKVYGEE